MTMVKLSKDFSIATSEIDYLVTYTCNSALGRKIRALKAENKCIDLSGHNKANTAVFTKKGTVILTTTLHDTLIDRVHEADSFREVS